LRCRACRLGVADMEQALDTTCSIADLVER
jgi:hypothetical protein